MERAHTIRSIIQAELDNRAYAVDNQFFVEDLFSKESLRLFFERTIGGHTLHLLNKRIDTASVQRLSHAAATYLLGISLRKHLEIDFHLFPNPLSDAVPSSGFHYFWALTCLCHDLGYDYENNCSDLSRMDTEDGRRELFDITYDLFLFNPSILSSVDPSCKATMQWIVDSLELVKKYDKLRRNTTLRKKVIDHGIAGALILYDILCRENCINPEDPISRHSEGNNGIGVLDSYFPPELKDYHFLSILTIVLSVARHNLWLASTEAEIQEYSEFGLNQLLHNNPGCKIDATKQEEQILFLLEFLDTIDPIKGIYTRLADRQIPFPSQTELDEAKQFVLDEIYVQFTSTADFIQDNDTLYRSFTLFYSGDSPIDKFVNYINSTKNIHTWLAAKAPAYISSPIAQITYYYPALSKHITSWPYGINDDEITAIMLYEGSGIPGKNGLFYSYQNAYQTFNLLLMPGKDGEDVRICREGQHPHSFYLRNWRKTLLILMDIFKAQCKYAKYSSSAFLTPPSPLYRCDREINLKLMDELGMTFAMTSTSKRTFLEEFQVGKQNPCRLRIAISDKTPYLDFSEVLRKNYTLAKEAEILLPPFMSIETLERNEHNTIEIKLGGMHPREIFSDVSYLYSFLDENATVAAEGLDIIILCKSISAIADTHVYWEWKASFQRLCYILMHQIYDTFYTETGELPE